MSVVRARFGDQVKGEIIRTTLDDAAKKTIEEQELKLAASQKWILQVLRMAVT